MKIVKSPKTSSCEASRCQDLGGYAVDGRVFPDVGRDVVYLCAKHAEGFDAVPVDSGAAEAPRGDTEAIALAAREKVEAEDALAIARELPVGSQADLEFVAEILQDVKGRFKRLDAAEKEITRPMNEALKATRALFKAPKDLFALIEREIKAKIATFAEAQAEHNRAALAEASERADAGDAEGSRAALANVANIADVKGISLRQTWTFDVEDALMLPAEYLLPNETMLTEAARRYGKGDGPELPGVRFYAKSTVAAKSGS